MSYKLTRAQTVKEIVKCGKDPAYFINNYAKISHPLKGLIPFKTYPYQTDMLEDFNDYRFNVILKARQLGISTITAAYVVWLMLFYRDKNVLVIATKFQTAANLVKKVKNIMQNVPPWLRIAEIKIDNRTSFVLTNGSEVKAASTSGDAGRSEALSLLIIDEAAHVDGLEELWTGLYPTLSTGGRYPLRMALVTGSTKLTLKQNRTRMISTLLIYHGMSTQKEIKSGLKKKLAICQNARLPKSYSAVSTHLAKQLYTLMI